ncbi:YfbK domain-containing protein [Yoonia sp. SDW83-1]|uniref:YfbK domain-containing protein n=1 Tax=Yoonia sp. SDW83-1 TaxID=3366945 RepID=UPI00398C36CF
MNDDLNDLKAMMDSATPRPDAARRAENLALAQKNFDDLQGSRAAPRPTPANGPKGLWTGVKTMLNTFTSKAALTTTTALVACGFLFLTPQGQDLLSPPSSSDITRTEFDATTGPNSETEPLLQEELLSDMPAQEPSIGAEDAVIPSPPQIPEDRGVAEAEPSAPPAPPGPAVNEPLTSPVVPGLGTTTSEMTDNDILQTLDDIAANRADEVVPDRDAEGPVFDAMPTAELKEGDMEAAPDASPNLERLRVDSMQRPAAPRTASPNAVTGTGMFDGSGRAPLIEPPAVPRHLRGQNGESVTLHSYSGETISVPTRPSPTEAISQPLPDTEAFPTEAPNDLKITSDEPVSTFSIDVDTAAYSVVRSSLSRGQLPPKQVVRIEELVNYFPYDYAAPDAGEAPFRPTISSFQTPWNADTQLVHIALQGEMPALDDRPPLNLVFLIDTSGSMNDPAKLPLLKQSFRLMLDQLRPEDEVAIVEYAGSAGQVLAPTAASERTTILQAIQSLGAGGSTNGQGGLQQAYAVAETMKEDGQVSRIILATDGDFNVGISNPNALKDFIADKRETGTYLSVLGFGRGNLDDATMQALAQNGNGTAAYIDTLSEAQKVLVDQLTGALFPIAGDVKVQVEFNPAQVAEYRLIGYETRALAREDFNNDKVDAGELGAGHSVTAIYEITPVGSPAQLSDPLRYAPNTVAASSDELGYVKLRYKEPGEDTSQLIETPIIGESIPGTEANFAAAIAGFGQLLRDDSYLGDWGYDDAIALANANRGEDPFGYRTEAVQLMRLAQSLSR